MAINNVPTSEKIEMEESSKQKITDLASQLHDDWRKPRWREATGDYEPRIKKTRDQAWSEANGGAVEVDIANTPYEELPNDWQYENRVSAEVAVTEVMEAIRSDIKLDDFFIESASSVIHDRWLERNGEYASPEQKMPYPELSEEEQEKDRVIIRRAIKLCLERE